MKQKMGPDHLLDIDNIRTAGEARSVADYAKALMDVYTRFHAGEIDLGDAISSGRSLLEEGIQGASGARRAGDMIQSLRSFFCEAREQDEEKRRASALQLFVGLRGRRIHF